MKHFLGTRFNLKVPDWKTTKNGTTVLDEAYLHNRFELFEKYCFPSVENQSCQDFIWFVFFDIDTPEKYKNRVDQLKLKYTNFRPVFIDGIQNLQGQFIETVKGHIDKTDTYIITTRMDNDDLIHKDFIGTIQSLYQPVDGNVIDIQNGFQVTLKPDNSEIRNYAHPFNAFVSVIESVENITTIYSKMHYDWQHAPKVISYKSRKLWVELVHESNKVNHTMSNLKKAYTFDKDDFGLSAGFMFQIHTFDILKTNSVIAVQRLQKQIKEHRKFIKKLPKRYIRFLRKKIKKA